MKNIQDTDHVKNEVSIWLVVILVGIISIAPVLGTYLINFWGNLSEKQEVWGQFGDYVGGTLNPLFSFTTLIALLYTIRLQKKELDKAAKQLEISEEALKKQIEVSEKQRFESTFFQMLTLFNEVINSIETTVIIPELIEDNGEVFQLPPTCNSDTKIVKGRQCFNHFYERIKERYDDLGVACSEEDIAQINESYKDFYSFYQYEIGHYFRMLYNIIKLIKNSNIHNKYFYTNLVRAQLSTQELLVIFYNGLSDLGNEKFKPLIEEFALLKTIPKNRLIKPWHQKLYADRAYLRSQDY